MRKWNRMPQMYFLGLFLCFTAQSASSQSNQKIKFNGNEIELISNPSDTIYVENIETGEREMKISKPDDYPKAINGLHIIKEVQNPPLPERSLNEYFIDLVLQNKALFDQLSDGHYYLNPRHFVINEEGKIMYYKFEGLVSNKSKTTMK